MVPSGDPRVAFCEREFPRLVGALTLYTADRDLATELAQEALARACQHWSRVQRMEAPSAWVWRVAINLANRAFRKRRNRRRAEEAAMAQPEVDSDLSDAIAVRVALASLPARQRMALVLRYYGDLPVRDAAALMRCREGTVKALTHQGLGALRAQLASDDIEEISDVR